MRGLTITDAFVLADEVQNASTQQVGTLCTRAGERCKLVFTGDPGQVDKKKANWATSGWLSWLSRFEPKPEAPEVYPYPEARCVRLKNEDVVRSAAAKFAAEIMEQQLQAEAEAEPQTRAGGLAAAALRGVQGGGASAAPPPAAQLPEGWQSFVDDRTGKTYYYNSELNQTSWAPPSAPMVEL